MPITPTAEIMVLNALLDGPRWVSLHTGDPTGGNEVVGNGYARQPVTFSASGANPTTYFNDTALQYPIATADWGTISWFGIYDAVGGGNLLGYEPVDVPRNVLASDIVRWEIGQISVVAD